MGSASGYPGAGRPYRPLYWTTIRRISSAVAAPATAPRAVTVKYSARRRRGSFGSSPRSARKATALRAEDSETNRRAWLPVTCPAVPIRAPEYLDAAATAAAHIAAIAVV